MVEEEQQQQVDENKRIRPRERARGQKTLLETESISLLKTCINSVSNQINLYDFWLIGNILLWFSSRAATISWMHITILFKLTTEIKFSYQLNPTH